MNSQLFTILNGISGQNKLLDILMIFATQYLPLLMGFFVLYLLLRNLKNITIAL